MGNTSSRMLEIASFESIGFVDFLYVAKRRRI